MATYMEDDETSKLIEDYAKAQGKTKAAALRDLLLRELKAGTNKSGEDRFQDTLAYVLAHPTEQSPIKPADIESLYEYLDAN